MTWHTAALCTAFSRTSSLNKVSLGLVLTSVCIFPCCFFRNTCTCGLLGFFPLCAEPVCAVGQGVSALCCATEGQRWIFSGYSLTGVSVW